MRSPTQFELETVFRVDAAEIIASKQKALMIHRSTDIKAAGNEVEKTFRSTLARRMPTGFYVGHGHVVDEDWRCSGQLDVIVADNFACPVLFRAQDDTEYFPYESVYAIGEVKSSYSANDIAVFSKKLVNLRSNLIREPTPNGFIPYARGRGMEIVGMNSSDRRDFKNPLFSFMLFVASDGITRHLKKELLGKPVDQLPSVICCLDKGVIGLARFVDEDFTGFHTTPEFARSYDDAGGYTEWSWWFNSDGDYVSSGALAYLYLLLLDHVHTCVLMPPNLMNYGRHVLEAGAPRWERVEAP